MIFGLSKLKAYGIVAGLAALALAWAVYSIRRDAQADLILKIERTEADARKNAVEGARSVDECWDANGAWDRSSGKCALP